MYVRINHLQHKDFQYVISIENSSSQTQNGTIRLFMAQKKDTRGTELIFEELRTLWFELDRFSYECECYKVLLNDWLVRSSFVLVIFEFGFC